LNVLFLLSALATAQVPSHHYALDTLNDDLGGPALTSLGGSLSDGGYRFGPNQGLRLTNVVQPDVYTIDVTFSFDQLGSWRKIIDFKNLGSDNGLYTFDNALQFVVTAGVHFETSPPIFSVDTMTRVTLTRDDAGVVNGYVNGAPEISFVDFDGGAAFSTPVANFFVDDPLTAGGESSGGLVRELRLYDRALSASEVLTLGPWDGGPSDAGPSDAGPSDAGPSDAGPSDAGPSDAGPSDAGPPDAGQLDAGTADVGTPDAGSTDVDAGQLVASGERHLAVGTGCSEVTGGLAVPVMIALFRRRRRARAGLDP
jgi:hypothetical protein